MINKRTGEPGLAKLKNRLKSETDEVARHELNRLKARTSSQIEEEEKGKSVLGSIEYTTL